MSGLKPVPRMPKWPSTDEGERGGKQCPERNREAGSQRLSPALDACHADRPRRQSSGARRRSPRSTPSPGHPHRRPADRADQREPDRRAQSHDHRRTPQSASAACPMASEETQTATHRRIGPDHKAVEPKLPPMAHVPPARHLLRARDLADARYFEPLDVDDMARAAGLSRAHFSREFRRAFGESPHAYLLTRRLERAAALLRTTDNSVAEICLAVGLQSIGSFTTSFSRTFGQSPTAYRASFPPRPPTLASRPASCAPTAGPNTARFEKTAARCPPSIGDDLFRTSKENTDDQDRKRAAMGPRPGRGPRLLHREARHGGASRRHPRRDGRLPLAHRRPARPGGRLDHR